MREIWNTVRNTLKGTRQEQVAQGRFKPGDNVVRKQILLEFGTNKPVENIEEGQVLAVVPPGVDALDAFERIPNRPTNNRAIGNEDTRSTVSTTTTYLVLFERTIVWVHEDELSLKK